VKKEEFGSFEELKRWRQWREKMERDDRLLWVVVKKFIFFIEGRWN
jgi:hypothetical protein